MKFWCTSVDALKLSHVLWYLLYIAIIRGDFKWNKLTITTDKPITSADVYIGTDLYSFETLTKEAENTYKSVKSLQTAKDSTRYVIIEANQRDDNKEKGYNKVAVAKK